MSGSAKVRSGQQPLNCSDADWSIEIDGITKSQWHDVIRNFEDASLYQTWSYGEARWGRHRLSHLVLRKGGDQVAAAQIMVHRAPIVGGGIAFVKWGPLWRRRGEEADPAVFRRVATVLRQEYANRRGLLLRLAPNQPDDGSGSLSSLLALEGFSPTDKLVPGYRTFLIDLRRTTEEITSAMKPKWRSHLKKAAKNSLKVKEGTSDELLHTFISLYAEMRKRKPFPENMGVESYAYVQRDLPLSLRLQLFVCEAAAEPVAAVGISAIGDTGHYFLGATGDKGLSLYASYLLHWRVVEWLKAQGYRWYDLFGLDPELNPGVYQFKAGLAGKGASESYHIGSFDVAGNLWSAAGVRLADRLRAAIWNARMRSMRVRRSAPPQA